MNRNSAEAVLRILDASANRVGEGLRTVEEWARFALDDHELSTELKLIRHQVAGALAVLPRHRMLAARDTVGDVGTEISSPSEHVRNHAGEVVVAGISRTGQSLRVMEEYLKTIDADSAATIEQARYRFYTAAAKLELQLSRHDRVQRIRQAKLYVLIDARPSETEFKETVATLSAAGVDVLQLRDRSQTDRKLIARAQVGTEIAGKQGTLFIMNDRADLALAAGCDGVHVGQDELPAAKAREILGHDRLVGVSTHSIDQADEAAASGADYIGCGPVFPSRTKSFDQFPGLAYVREVADQIQIPSFAIGGIDESNLDQVIAAGGNRIAVTSAVRDCQDIVATVRRINAKLAAIESSR
jgi:thiamine-phosphate pyrophosphorylase